MDLRIGFGLGIYYVILLLVFLGINQFGAEFDTIDVNATTNVDINTSAVTAGEIDQGGFFTVGLTFSRFLDWTSFAVFLPDNTPQWFLEIFTIWQGLMNLLAIMWLFASVWNG